MKIKLGCLALVLTSWASVAHAQTQAVITPPPEGAPIVAGALYVGGTTFANGMAYPPAVAPPVVAPAVYQAQTTTSYYPATSSYQTYVPTDSGVVYSSGTYYGGGYSGYGSRYSGYGNRGYGSNIGIGISLGGGYNRGNGGNGGGRGFGGGGRRR